MAKRAGNGEYIPNIFSEPNCLKLKVTKARRGINIYTHFLLLFLTIIAKIMVLNVKTV